MKVGHDGFAYIPAISWVLAAQVGSHSEGGAFLQSVLLLYQMVVDGRRRLRRQGTLGSFRSALPRTLGMRQARASERSGAGNRQALGPENLIQEERMVYQMGQRTTKGHTGWFTAGFPHLRAMAIEITRLLTEAATQSDTTRSCAVS